MSDELRFLPFYPLPPDPRAFIRSPDVESESADELRLRLLSEAEARKIVEAQAFEWQKQLLVANYRLRCNEESCTRLKNAVAALIVYAFIATILHPVREGASPMQWSTVAFMLGCGLLLVLIYGITIWADKR